jgi:hypothetical protein
LAIIGTSTGGLPWVRRTTSPYAGSLFATYMGSASCFLRTPHFWKLPLPCWRGPSVR